MPASARRAAGIIRNVLPKRLIEKPRPPVYLRSEEERINRQQQIIKWEATKKKLLQTTQGRKYLAQYFPRTYQKALLAERFPNAVQSSESTPTIITGDVKHISPRIHERIMSQTTPIHPSLPPFPLGSKKVYLPNFVIILKRNPPLEPYHAVFEVPLNLGKLDLRDYLWNLYGVKSLSIRSSILPGVLKRKYTKGRSRPRFGPMIRTKARKKMIVQLAKPFLYPRQLNDEELKEYKLLLVEVVNFRFQKERYDQASKKRTKAYRQKMFGLTPNPHPKYDFIRKQGL